MTRLVVVGERRDKRGRRIGRNWWREHIMEAFTGALLTVEAHREDNHQMEPDEYALAHPLPQLKDLLIAEAGATHGAPEV